MATTSAPAPPAVAVPKVLTSLDEFDVWAFSSPSALHILYFWAAWDPASAPGGAFDRLLTTLAALHPTALFARVEAEEVPDVSDQFGVAVVPTVVLLRARQVIDRVEGPRAADLTAAVEARMNEAPQARSVRGGTEIASLEAVRARIAALLDAAPVMLFMKGTPDEPKCKFSRRIVELLREVEASFGSFNILTDPALREALREFSNWPTYPQLYVRGKLLGGVDVVQEMMDEGELRNAVAVSLPAAVAVPAVDGGATSDSDAALAGAAAARAAIASAPCVLFMKGPTATPACGFSEQAVKLLTAGGVPFTAVDVLTAPVLREAVKKLGDFPTYPQLWLRGELVGGVDALREATARAGGGAGALAVAFALPPTVPVEPLEARLRRLVSAAPAVLFLKGMPGAPRCGFSASALSLLDDVGVDTRAAVSASAAAATGGARFATFDILEDQAVREGIKTLFAWPTYPQLYVKGKLVGGLDVLREMQEEGELEGLLRDAGVIGIAHSSAQDNQASHGHSHGDGAVCSGGH